MMKVKITDVAKAQRRFHCHSFSCYQSHPLRIPLKRPIKLEQAIQALGYSPGYHCPQL